MSERKMNNVGVTHASRSILTSCSVGSDGPTSGPSSTSRPLPFSAHRSSVTARDDDRPLSDRRDLDLESSSSPRRLCRLS